MECLSEPAAKPTEAGLPQPSFVKLETVGIGDAAVIEQGFEPPRSQFLPNQWSSDDCDTQPLHCGRKFEPRTVEVHEPATGLQAGKIAIKLSIPVPSEFG